VQVKPFELVGSKKTVILFIHGFTASPSEIYPTAQLINEYTGWTVEGILLPGHGLTPQALNSTSWEDWYGAVEYACKELLAVYQNVFVAGLSMGGLLSIYAGLKIPEINGVISINAPIINKSSFKVALLPLISKVKSCYPKNAGQREEELYRMGRFAYSCYPLKAFKSMLKFRDLVKNQINNLNVPLLAVQSQMDESVRVESLKYIAAKINKKWLTSLELPNSDHVATMGNDKELLAQRIVQFINKVLKEEEI